MIGRALYCTDTSSLCRRLQLLPACTAASPLWGVKRQLAIIRLFLRSICDRQLFLHGQLSSTDVVPPLVQATIGKSRGADLCVYLQQH